MAGYRAVVCDAFINNNLEKYDLESEDTFFLLSKKETNK